MVDVNVSLRYESLTAHGFRRSVLFSGVIRGRSITLQLYFVYEKKSNQAFRHCLQIVIVYAFPCMKCLKYLALLLFRTMKTD